MVVTRITALMVKRLRMITGAPMMDCNRALEETGGDMKKAQHLLNRRGYRGSA